MATRAEKFRFQGKAIHKLPVFLAAKPIDGRKTYTRAELTAILNTTNELMQSRALAPAVKIGHRDYNSDRSQQPRRGYVDRFYRGKLAMPGDNAPKVDAIFADVVVDRALAEDYEAGKYPGISAELYPLYWLEKYNETGGPGNEFFIDAIAFLGEDSPAFPELFSGAKAPKQFFSVILPHQMKENDMDMEHIGEQLKELDAKHEALKAEFEAKEPDKDKVLKAIDAFAEVLLAIRDYIESETDAEAEDGVEDEAPPAEENSKSVVGTVRRLMGMDKIDIRYRRPIRQHSPAPGHTKSESELLNRIAVLERERATQRTSERESVFDTLVANGKIVKQERELFDTIAEKMGLDYARNHFAARNEHLGPAQAKLRDLGDVYREAGDEGFSAELDKLGLDSAQKAKYVAAYADASRKGILLDHSQLHKGVN